MATRQHSRLHIPGCAVTAGFFVIGGSARLGEARLVMDEVPALANDGVVQCAEDPLASALAHLDLGQHPPPAEPPGATIDARTVWDLFADVNADGVIDSGDILVSHEECVALERANLIDIRLASVAVGTGRHVLKIKCIVDVRVRANVVDCVPVAVVGSPGLNAQLRLEVIPDAFGTP